MEKKRAPRNRTLSIHEEEIPTLLQRCLREEDISPEQEVINSVIHGNIFQVAHQLPSEFVDLLVVDPPYNLDKKFGDSTFRKMNTEEYEEYTDKWISAVKHTLTPKASIYVCCDWKSSLSIGKILGKHFTIQNRITWQREKGRGAKSNWKNGMEDIWFATVSKKDYTFHVDDVKLRRKVLAPYRDNGTPKDWTESEDGNFRDTFPSNFWDDISIPYWSMPENTEHPTQKPEKLFAKLLLASSNKGDVVFDPFLGSGTTAVVAKKLGRRFLGVELEEVYCAMTQKRLDLAEETSEIQGYVDGVFWERNTLAYQKKSQSKKK